MVSSSFCQLRLRPNYFIAALYDYNCTVLHNLVYSLIRTMRLSAILYLGPHIIFNINITSNKFININYLIINFGMNLLRVRFNS